MADFYLTQTGDEVQELLNTVDPTAQYANASIAVVGDKSYTPDAFSGLGRVNLEKNIQTIEGVEKNILTQDMFYKTVDGQRVPNTNTIFIIQYDYDLNDPNGENPITIPEGCVLKFDGGSIKNGSLIGQNTKFENATKGCLEGVILEGTFNGDVFHVNWVYPDTTNVPDIADTLQVAINNYDNVCIDNGNYTITKTVILRSNVAIFGESKENTKIIASLARLKDGTIKYTMFSVGEVTIGWNTNNAQRHANTNNLNDEILVTNVTIKDITFDLNRHSIDFEDVASGFLSASCVCVYFIDISNSSITNCNFIDYQNEGHDPIDGWYPNNGTKCIQLYNTNDCKITKCYTERTSFLLAGKGINNEAAYNIGVRSVSTWIEGTNYFKYFYVHDNQLTDVYWEVSMMSTNSQFGIIEGNTITSTLGIYHASAFTFGHAGDQYDASFGAFRNNTIYLDICKHGVLVQRGSNIIIENNNITIEKLRTAEEDAEYNTWSLRKGQDAGCIRIGVGVQGSVYNISGNTLVHGQYNCIYLSVQAQNASFTISENKMNAGTTCIEYAGTSDGNTHVKCDNNTMVSTYAILNTVKLESTTISIIRNYISGFVLGADIVDENTFDGSPINAYDGVNLVCFLKLYNISCKRNIFNTLGNSITYAILCLKSTYDNELAKVNIYDEIKDNIFVTQADESKGCRLRFKDGTWQSIILNPAVYAGKGDVSQISLSSYNKGITLYDTVNDKPVWWNGTAWVDATGTAVS